MKRIKSLLTVVIISFCVLFFSPMMSEAAPIRETDTKVASEGNVLIGVEGTYARVSKNTILKRINEIRKEACDKGYPNPKTGEKLKSSDYVPMQWSSDLEWIAQIRAAEASVCESHTRPNGKSCFSVSHNENSSWNECIAWNYNGIMYGIEQWYSEKEAWIKQDSSSVTGHYTALISPSNKMVGIGCFRRSTGGWYSVAGEFSFYTDMDTTQSNLKGDVVQIIEVKKDNLKSYKMDAPSSLKRKKSKNLNISRTVVYPGIMGGNNETKVFIMGKIVWKSSKPGVIKVNSKGRITARKKGKAKITAIFSDGKKISKVIKVK